MITRRIINITAANDHLCALCDDGSVWVTGVDANSTWKKYPEIPQQHEESVNESDTSIITT